MPVRKIEFETSDRVTLRGRLYTPQSFTGKLPCLIMAPGFAGLRVMGLEAPAEYFTSKLPLACVAYDNRGFGESDTKEGEPIREVLPHLQISDYSDAITFAQSLPEIDSNKIGIWGSSYSGAHVLCVGAIDRRVKAVLSQVPLTSGWQNFHRAFRPGTISSLNQAFQEVLPPKIVWLVHKAKSRLVSLFLEAMRAYEPVAHIHRISPTPLLMSIVDDDAVAPQDIALQAFSLAKEPKQLKILHGGHFDPYEGKAFEVNVEVQTEFLKAHLC
ncbi:N-terminal domain [Fusarium acutatum]|uniref:N-terminal domain n=1 Tax=Fusarium acutatum TaxID=78861 RepID=A0A8H4NA94_9HYPO|nr:N-terminal domain [Fusarium acutatum]